MFNEQAQQVKLRISIKTFRKYVKKLYMTQYEVETPLISLIKYCMFSFFSQTNYVNFKTPSDCDLKYNRLKPCCKLL